VKRFDACHKDADELVCLIKQLTQTLGIRHLVLREQLQPESALLQLLQDDAAGICLRTIA
jgi:hypothetical protein